MSNRWTDQENDQIVADYFSMLHNDLRGLPFKKIDHNKILQHKLGRSKSSIEFKHQNISAVLQSLGEPWLDGYRPAYNFQLSLVDAVMRWFEAHPDWQQTLLQQAASAIAAPAQSPPLLKITEPPVIDEAIPDFDHGKAGTVIRRFDPTLRDQRNRALGRAGEERVLRHEQAALASAGRPDLAEQVRWTSVELGDGAGFDIESFYPNGRLRLIEVKTTNGWEHTPFHISRNELSISEQRPEEWCLVRVWDFARSPKAYELRPPLDRHVDLVAQSYRAVLRKHPAR